MRYSCAMTSPKDTSLEEEGADADGVDRDGAEREEGAAESICRDQNWASLHLTVALIYGTHDGKVVRRGKRNGKMA